MSSEISQGLAIVDASSQNIPKKIRLNSQTFAAYQE